jgi:hypothetical protein
MLIIVAQIVAANIKDACQVFRRLTQLKTNKSPTEANTDGKNRKQLWTDKITAARSVSNAIASNTTPQMTRKPTTMRRANFGNLSAIASSGPTIRAAAGIAGRR